MIRDFLHLETISLVAPLALRFRDVVTNTFVGDGLSVTLYPSGNDRRRVTAYANRAGVYVLHHAPGLEGFERGAGDEDFWKRLPSGKSFVVEVEDYERRFLPFSFTFDLPQRGIYRWLSPLDASPSASPLSPPSFAPATVSAVPLYSVPTRQPPAGLAVMRAELWNPFLAQPAAYAIVEARVDGELLARGIADERGRLALIFPYPQPLKFAVSSPVNSPADSPPAQRGPALFDQAWPITLSAAYTPSSPPATHDLNAGATDAPPMLPDLRAMLAQLLAPPATLWLDFAHGVSMPALTLRYGRELVLSSEDAVNNSPPAPRSVLFITPA